MIDTPDRNKSKIPQTVIAVCAGIIVGTVMSALGNYLSTFSTIGG